MIVPSPPEVFGWVVGHLELGLPGRIALKTGVGECVQQTSLVAEDSIQHRLRHPGRFAHGSGGDVAVERRDQLCLGCGEQCGAEVVIWLCHTPILFDLISPSVSVLR